MARERLRVSLVATLYNEAKGLKAWWESILSQTRRPDELVVVDGGSRDGTPEILAELSASAPFPVSVEVVEGCGIAAGRNRAIEKVSHPVIAVTDGGCVLHPEWLERLLRPMEEDPDIALVAGFYRPLAEGFFQEVVACATIPLPEELDEESFMPSSRSIAFRRKVWEMVGGYPEWLETGEDMYFNFRWKELAIRHAVASDAVVFWPMREDARSLFRQYFRYARGDGVAGMYPRRHLLRFSAYGCLSSALLRRKKMELALLAAAGCAYASRFWRRVPVYVTGGPATRAMAYAVVPALLFYIDLAKMAGYLDGLRRRIWTRGRRP
jgi:glycosyltransferase involved in cell wall biosynthesis